MHKGFTLIEVLISVLILSTSLIYILQIHSENTAFIHYLSKQSKETLADTLFLDTKSLASHHKEEVDAYTIVSKKGMRLEKIQDRQILEGIKRNIFLPEPIIVEPPVQQKPGRRLPTVEVQQINLKGEVHSAFYNRIRIYY